MARILVIDDDRLVRAYLADMLEGCGYTVRTLADGGAAAAAVAAEPPDLIFCDLFMPGKDGMETIRALRRVAPGVPILAMSGGGAYGLTDVLPTAVALGATAALSKPVSPAALAQAVLDHLPAGACH